MQLRRKAGSQQRLWSSWSLSSAVVSLSANTCQAAGLSRRLKPDGVWIVKGLGNRKCCTDLESYWAVDDRPVQNEMGPGLLEISSSGGFGFSPQTPTLSAVFLSPLQSYHRGIWLHSPWEGGR